MGDSSYATAAAPTIIVFGLLNTTRLYLLNLTLCYASGSAPVPCSNSAEVHEVHVDLVVEVVVLVVPVVVLS